MTWLNQDGLVVQFGAREAQAGRVGEYRSVGPQRFVEFNVDLVSLTSTATIQSFNTMLPRNARIERVEVIAQTAATSGGAATLSVGLVRTDTTTNVSDTALVNALALTAIDAAGETSNLIVGATGAGGSIGTSLANNAYITARWNTAAFTAGQLRIRIYYVMNL